MIKRIFLLFIVFFSICATINASDDRWVRVYDMYYASSNNKKLFIIEQTATKLYVDKQTATYDAKTNKITFWEKAVNTGGSERLTKFEFDLNTWDLKELQTATVKNGNISSRGKWVHDVIFTMEDSMEAGVKSICDYLNIGNQFKSSPHKWKYLLSKPQGFTFEPGTDLNPIIDFYICTDLYVKNYKPGVAKVFIKHYSSADKDRDKKKMGPKYNFTLPYLVDFNKHSVNMQMLHSREENNIVPDSLEEAIYNETLRMISN